MSSTSTREIPGTRLIVKSLDEPDERRQAAGKGEIELVSLGETRLVRATFQPGWRWSEHVQPAAGTDLCEVVHTGYVVSGRQAVRMADGTEMELGPGDAFVIGAGHDSWVIGDEPCVTIDFTGGAPSAHSAGVAAGHALKAIDDMQSIHHGLVKLAAAELGVETFGLQVLDMPPGFDQYPEHDHAEDGQEEVYVLLAGSAECEIDGERRELEAGQMLRVGPASKRNLQAGSEGARILAIGCAPAGAYERPEDFRLAVRS
jgi:quercetin dioxygenase-like cupin family protein